MQSKFLIINSSIYIRTLKFYRQMAIIGKIREKSVLLVAIIGLALIAFIFTDWNKGGGGSEDQIGYGTIAGEVIDDKKLNEAQDNFVNNDEQQAYQSQKPYTDQDRQASRDKAWNYVVESTILEKEMEALGIQVGEDEFDSYLYGRDGFPVLQEFLENFKDSATGLFNSRLLQQRIEQMESSEDPKDQKAWDDSKKYYIERRRQEKYFTLLNQGVYATKVEAEDEYLAQNEVKSISYAVRRYTDIKDEAIKVTDAEMKAYYEEHKNDKIYENKSASREIKYFDIAIEPSKEDIAEFQKEITKLKADFASTKDDSTFVVRNSEVKQYMGGHVMTFMPEGNPKAQQGLTYPVQMDSVFQRASVGQIVGPYEDKGTMRMAKVIDFNKYLLTVRHILLKASREDAAMVAKMKNKADSLLGILNQSNFDENVKKFSEDEGSVPTGGLFEDFMDFTMVPEFGNFANENPVGTIGKVQTQFGWHIIEVVAKKPQNYPVLAVVQKTLKPKSGTLAETGDKVNDLLYKLDSRMSGKKDGKAKVEAFDTLAAKMGYVARSITLNEDKIVFYGFTNTFVEDKLIKLAFDEDVEVGKLCGSPIKDKDRYIIACVSKVKEAGVPTFEDIEETIKAKVIQEKKAKRFINSMKDGSLAAMAKKNKLEVLTAEVAFAKTEVGEARSEPEVVGAIFSALKKGQKTEPVKGQSGVFVVRVDKITKAPATNNYKDVKASLETNMKTTAGNLAKSALIEKAKVVDNRRFRSTGVRM